MERIDKILFFVDSETPTAAPIEKAVAMAKALGASLTFAGVVPSKQRSRLFTLGGPSAEDLERLYIENETARLEELVVSHRDRGVPLSTRVLVGKPGVAIAQAVRDEGYAMVWKAPAQDAHPSDRVMGSVDMRLIRTCPCPVFILDERPPPQGRGRIIAAAIEVVPVPDDQDSNDELNRRILELALRAKVDDEDRIHVIHAWTLYGESILESPRFGMERDELDALRENERNARQKKLEVLLADFAARLDPSDASRFAPEIHLVQGDPNTAIPRAVAALDADILVMGTVSRSGVSGLILGNTAEEILGRQQCSVGVTKPEGFVSPV